MVDSKHQWKAWIYLAPAIVLLLIFTVWPIINTLRMAFLEGYNTMEAVNPYINKVFNVGIGNFVRVISYPGFITCLKNTMLLTVLTVPISTFLALLIAVALNSIKPFQRLLQTIFVLPYVTNSIAIGMVFAAMFNMIIGGGTRPDSVGIINNILEIFGIDYINWMNAGSQYWANIVVMVVYIVWNALPFKILILLGGLQSVNKQYYEAARVDSTPRWRVFTRITIPLALPIILYHFVGCFAGIYNEYLWASLILRSNPTLMVIMHSSVASGDIQYGASYAMYLISSLPLIATAIISIKYFKSGEFAAGLKL